MSQDELGYCELKCWELSCFNLFRPHELLYWNLDRQQNLMDVISFFILFLPCPESKLE